MIGGTMMVPAENVSKSSLATQIQILGRWNGLEPVAAALELLPCCGSRTWCREMAKRRPLLDEAEVLAAADAAWWNCGEADWREAFASHPRIGERRVHVGVPQQSLAWSRQEQSEALHDEGETARLLHEANLAYEARFGMTFLVFANGRSGAEILRILNDRMRNDPETELAEAAEQQRQITALRLSRWMGAL